MNSEDVCGTKNTNSEDVSTKVAGKNSRRVKNKMIQNCRQTQKNISRWVKKISRRVTNIFAPKNQNLIFI